MPEVRIVAMGRSTLLGLLAPWERAGNGEAMSTQAGRKNPNWRGGRSVASNGYVLILVGKGHHLADVRGYAYEHRLVAEQKLGRRLRKGEIPHHVNGIKTDNRHENIEVVESGHAHQYRHRKRPSGRRKPGEVNRLIVCACGCGGTFMLFDANGRPRSFLPHHNVAHGLNGQWQPKRLPPGAVR